MEEFYNLKDQEDEWELADEAMRNTYDFVIGGYSWNNIPEAFWMLDKPKSKQAIKHLIEYFEETEEYEKCSHLHNIQEIVRRI